MIGCSSNTVSWSSLISAGQIPPLMISGQAGSLLSQPSGGLLARAGYIHRPWSNDCIAGWLFSGTSSFTIFEHTYTLTKNTIASMIHKIFSILLSVMHSPLLNTTRKYMPVVFTCQHQKLIYNDCRLPKPTIQPPSSKERIALPRLAVFYFSDVRYDSASLNHLFYTDIYKRAVLLGYASSICL